MCSRLLYSKYPEVIALKDKPAGSVIVILKSIFARQCIPEVLFSDNMPFASHQCKAFANAYGFEINTSSPRFAQYNGMVERTIGTIKQLLRKADDSYLALLEYRNTPVTGLKYSPSQILNSRRLRTRLPVASHLLDPSVASDVRSQLVDIQMKHRFYHDRSAKPLSGLNPDDSIRVHNGSSWEPAVVLARHDAPRSYIVATERGSEIRRNRRHIQKTAEPPHHVTRGDYMNSHQSADPVDAN